jgi:hypothetical protein
VETDLDDNNMDNELAKQVHRKGVTQIEVLIVAEEEKQIGYVSD